MKKIRILLLVLVALVIFGAVFMKGLAPAELPGSVASEIATVADPGGAPLASVVWYPASIGKPADKGKHPLIIISHGTGGTNRGHADLAAALATAGFVVVAVEHTGDNYRDLSHVDGGKYLIERPRHVSRAIDFMLTKWRGRSAIDPERVGVFGHSAGGYTALVVAGAKPDLSLGEAFCKAQPTVWTCQYVQRHHMNLDQYKSVQWVSDPRVKAIVIAAPAIGFSFDRESMASVKVPVQLWEVERDDIVEDSAQVIGRLLPAAERHREKGTGHFSFLPPCNWQMRTVIGVMHWFGTESICEDAGPLDRTQFHEKMNGAVVHFFERSM